MKYLKNIILSIQVSLLFGCGETQIFDQGTYTASEQFLITEENKCSECEKLQDAFIDDFSLNDSPVPIGLADLTDDKVGACYMFQSGEPAYIKISRSHWNQMTFNSKKALIYHELGHCLLKLGHLDDYNLVEDPEHDIFFVIKLSIMNPTMMTSFQASYVDFYWEEYKLALERNQSIDSTNLDDIELIRENYYQDIQYLEYEEEINENIKKINEELIYSNLCYEGDKIFRNLEEVEKALEEGLDLSCE